MTRMRQGRHWINGAWTTGGTQRESVNPASGEVIGSYYDGGIAEAKAAITAARRTFQATDWKADAMQRSVALNRLVDAFEARLGEVVETLCAENGKVKEEALFETGLVPRTLRFMAGLAMQTFGRVLESKPGNLSMVLREPIGVSGHIIPWNSPVVLLFRAIAPALAAGTTVVAKMPSQSALTAALLSDIISQVKEFPAGAVNIFCESGAEGAKFLVSDPAVAAISFTGSTATGRAIAKAGAEHFKRLDLELGGKSPHLIFDDADIDAALPKLEKSITVFAGQFCMTAGRLLVQRGVAPRLRQSLAARLEAVRVGPASDPASQMGPLIDKASVGRVDRMVEEAIAQGAKVIVRGGPVHDAGLADGAFYRPTLLEVDDGDLRIAREEVFGPVQVMQVFDDEQEAVDLANDSIYGLGASIWSRDSNRLMRVARQIEAGLVSINDWVNVAAQFETGGFKHSGIGRMGGVGSLDNYLEYKQIGQVYRSPLA